MTLYEKQIEAILRNYNELCNKDCKECPLNDEEFCKNPIEDWCLPDLLSCGGAMVWKGIVKAQDVNCFGEEIENGES